MGTEFVVGDRTLAATNAHALPAVLDGGGAPEALVAVLPSVEPSRVVARRLARIAVDGDHDFALLKMDGPVLRPVTFRDWASVVEGDMLLIAS